MEEKKSMCKVVCMIFFSKKNYKTMSVWIVYVCAGFNLLWNHFMTANSHKINALFTNDIKPLDDKFHMLSLTYTYTFNKCWIYTVTALFYNQRNCDFWHMQY